MAQVATMNQAQLQILDMLSFIKTPEALRDLNKVISDYFVQMADAELDRMWSSPCRRDGEVEKSALRAVYSLAPEERGLG